MGSEPLASSFSRLALGCSSTASASLAGDGAVPIGHTPFSWGIPSEARAAGSSVKGPRDGAAGAGGEGAGFVEWPPPVLSVLQCVVVAAAGSVDWSNGEYPTEHGPQHFRSRRLLTLADLPGVALLGHREFPSSVQSEHCHPPYATWWLHLAEEEEGRVRFYLQSAFSSRFLCRCICTHTRERVYV